jgi:hypothetical protein
MNMNYLDILGLTLGFSGTLLIFFAYAGDPKEWVENEPGMKPGEKRHTVYIKHPLYLKLGILLVAVGFLSSLFNTLLN